MAISEQIDDIDAKILNYLQENARLANAEIARRIGMAPSGVFERIRKLEARGVIQDYQARIHPAALGQDLLAYVFVRVEDPSGSFHTAKLLARIPEAQEVHHIAGEDCYLLKVRARNTEELGRLLRQKVGTIKSVRSTRTTIVLSAIKETSRLVLPPADDKTRKTKRR